jgi:hypothetical protein
MFKKLNFRDIELALSLILIPLFWPFLIGSDESGLIYVAEQLIPHSPAVVQITLSSAKLCLSLSEADSFGALWNETFVR